MQLLFHGGLCCGIKTIQGFDDPESKLYPVEKLTVNDNDQSGGRQTGPSVSFFTDEAPQETVEERFVRLIEFCKRRRPQGMIELVLAGNVWVDVRSKRKMMNDVWQPIVEKHGFKCVAQAKNINTSNICYVYYLEYETKPVKKEKAVFAASDETAVGCGCFDCVGLRASEGE